MSPDAPEWEPIRALGETPQDTPVVRVRDRRQVHRDQLVLWSDEDRQVIARLIDRGRRQLERQDEEPGRQRVLDSWWARAGVVVLGLTWGVSAAQLILVSLHR